MSGMQKKETFVPVRPRMMLSKIVEGMWIVD